MDNHRELFEALLAGKTLTHTQSDGTILRVKLDEGGLVTNYYDILNYYRWSIQKETININGHEVPAPERKELGYSDVYFTADLVADELYSGPYSWLRQETDFTWLRKGMIHLDKESAILHTKALLTFTETKNEE